METDAIKKADSGMGGTKIMIAYSRDAFSPNKVFVNRVIKKQSGTRKGSVNTNQWT